MYLTAHRVVSPAGDQEGVNAFRYTHGNYIWSGPPPAQFRPDADPGALVNQVVVVRPPGNRVRSFLDLVAPENVEAQELRTAAQAIMRGEVPTTFPAEWTYGRVWARFGVDRALAPLWRSELQTLLAGIAQVFG